MQYRELGIKELQLGVCTQLFLLLNSRGSLLIAETPAARTKVPCIVWTSLRVRYKDVIGSVISEVEIRFRKYLSLVWIQFRILMVDMFWRSIVWSSYCWEVIHIHKFTQQHQHNYSIEWKGRTYLWMRHFWWIWSERKKKK